ncbi:hypothetical protein G0Q06_07080 [Puniceicoccales bacterium CK1056]|uniref:Cadherin domain-containing protein n=1 Tax=Oceanipulchritudo coccoides TaxID=2706888 RepID=A0A6B2M322_9BACT|nr:polysaccharide lyase family 7 protein [Oceanipulchritudo coccoides]NDV62205.1 hypothetical protein [Oceanipulchritudo coccoides]
MITKRHITATLAALLAVPAFVSAVAPSTESKFLDALAASKLQYPDSSTAADTAALLAGYDQPYFTLQDTDKMAFTHDIADQRVELRNLQNWIVNTGVRTAHANLSVISQVGEQVTVMQIHDDANVGSGPNLPLVRIYRLLSTGHIWAVYKTDATGTVNAQVDLGLMPLGTYFDCDIVVNNGNMEVLIDSVSKLSVDVSYWTYPSYWKAGLYLQDAGAATVRFNELTWTTSAMPEIVNDDFADGNRANTGALQADWWSSSSTSGSSIEAYVGQLGLITGTSGRGIHGTFAPQPLDVGGSLTATMTFTTPATVGTAKEASFKFAIMAFNDSGLADDLSSSSSSVNPLYVGLPGYMIDFDVNTGATANINISEHDLLDPQGRFLGTTSEWDAISSSSGFGYTFSPATEYVVVITVTRLTTDGLGITALLSTGGSPIASYTASDIDGTIANNFGMLGVWANSNTFGSTTTAGAAEDNGITFSNITIQAEGILVGNQAPTFTTDPITETNATQDLNYSGNTLADYATDFENDPLTFTLVSSSGPGTAWLVVDPSGALSGTPNAANLGLHTYTVQVADAGGSNTATLNITVAPNQAPTFTSDPITKLDATEGVDYSGNTLADDATDFENDSLTFTKVSSSGPGPDWLVVDPNGALSGTPTVANIGLHTYTVQVADALGSDTATLNITVVSSFTGGTLVDDSFADGNRANTGALEADWWSSSSTSGNSIEAYVGELGLISGTSGRGIHGTFAPQTLAVGDSLTATMSFTTPVTVGSGKSTALKFALMDFNNPGLADDLSSSSSSSNPLYVGLPGYMIDLDVNTGATANITVREHNVASTLGRFLGTTSEWDSISNSSSDGYTFNATTDYVVVITVTRTGSGILEIFASLSLASGGAPLATHTASDLDGTIANTFGMLGAWVNSSTFGSTTSSGATADNGITFTNIKVETALNTSGNTPPVASDNSGSVDENAAIGDDVLTVTATDDGSISGYEIIDGNTGGAFSIDSSGLIEVAAPLDFDATSSYTLTVSVSDDGTPALKDFAEVTITVNDVVTNQDIISAFLSDAGGPFPGETDLAIIGDGADPDGDGHLNFMEVWQGTDAGTIDSPVPLILEEHEVSTIVRGSVVIETDSAQDDALDVVVEASFDLTNWRDISANRVVESDVGGVRTLRFYDSDPLGSNPFFIRFSIDPDAVPAP